MWPSSVSQPVWFPRHQRPHMAWVWGFTDCLMCLGVCVRTRVWSHEGLSVQLVIFLALIPLSAAAAPLIGCSWTDIQCSGTLGDTEWLITWVNDRHTQNKCLFRADLSLIYTPCVSLLERFILKMTLLARKKKIDSNLQWWAWKASAFVVVIQCVCVCVPAYVGVHLPANVNIAALPNLSSYITSMELWKGLS